MEYLVLGKAGEQGLISPFCNTRGVDVVVPCPTLGMCIGWFSVCRDVTLEPWGIPIEP